MIEEKAIIVDVAEDVAWVETQRQSTCSACQVRKACGTSVLHEVLGKKRSRLKVMNPKSFKIGDEVILGLQENALVYGSLILYAQPLLFMFTAALLGYGVFLLYDLEYTEGYKILFSLAGLVGGFLRVSVQSKKFSSDPNFQAVILSKLVT